MLRTEPIDHDADPAGELDRCLGHTHSAHEVGSRLTVVELTARLGGQIGELVPSDCLEPWVLLDRCVCCRFRLVSSTSGVFAARREGEHAEQ